MIEEESGLEYEDLLSVEVIGRHDSIIVDRVERLWLVGDQCVDVVVFGNPTEPYKGEPRFSVSTKIGGFNRKQLSGLISGLCYLYNKYNERLR